MRAAGDIRYNPAFHFQRIDAWCKVPGTVLHSLGVGKKALHLLGLVPASAWF